MEQYQWAVRVTTEYFESGSTWRPVVEERTCRHEAEARARHEAISDFIGGRSVVAKAQRITSVELIRRPVGEWEAVA